MADKWEDKGVCNNMEHDLLDCFLPESMQTHSHKVENTKTGEERQLRVEADQTVGEAIAKEQWED